jgi:hypothetical protein
VKRSALNRQVVGLSALAGAPEIESRGPRQISRGRAERRLVLLSAGTAERRRAVADQVCALAGDIDWSRLEANLRARKLLPLLGPRILEWEGLSPTASFADCVERSLAAGRRQGALLQLVSARLVAALGDAGIHVSALKGPLLAEALYGDPGRRLSSDIDLLVPPEQLGSAVDVVRAFGYRAPTDHVLEDGMPLLHFVLLHERDELPPVELHWRIHWYERSFAAERLLPTAARAAPDWRPEPVDELAALLLFYARDGFIDLRLATDLGAWWDARGAAVEIGAFEQLLDAYPALARAALAALKTAESVVGLPASKVVEDTARLGVRQRVAMRLANPNPHASSSQLYADAGLIDGLLAPAQGLGSFVRRQILPPREILDQQARHGDKRRARSRLGRFAGILLRYALTMSRLPRPPEGRRAPAPAPAE